MGKPKSTSGAGTVPIEGHVFYWLTLAINLRNASLTRSMSELGCTVPQWRVMNMLRQFPGVSIQQIAEVAAIDRTTLTRTIDGLERQGLISRDLRPDNRRVVALRLTGEGHAFYDRLLPLVHEQNDEALRGVSEVEFDQLLGGLKKIIVNLGGAIDASVAVPAANTSGSAASAPRG